ncbi:hypothetical protein CVT26_004443 [Gymnopilus dilepis]|uniref:Uncharacterized protein n=1 Tax=Gymnopilus dilepis TaxID=231916 RepID=A0A409W6U1_9AGAR|nr:hypothetical protein CVT26_004443 [Gymnopilus dilepis]
MVDERSEEGMSAQQPYALRGSLEAGPDPGTGNEGAATGQNRPALMTVVFVAQTPYVTEAWR